MSRERFVVCIQLKWNESAAEGTKMYIDLKSAARLLGTSPQMLLRWAKQGVIPTLEQDGAYLFDKNNLENWAKKRRIEIKKEPNHHSISTKEENVSLFGAMTAGGVHFGIQGTDAASLFASALQNITLPDNMDRDDIFGRLLEREQLASTAIGNGLAIPHPRYPVENTPKTGLISTCFTEEEIDFNAVDGQPIFVFFLIFSQNTKSHLHLLSQLSFFLHENEVVAYLRDCKSASNLLDRVQAFEQKFTQNNPRISRG